jgi:ribosomal protein S18 acetylase RimI-like enzyme
MKVNPQRKVVALAPDQIEQAGDVLSRAFLNDPLNVYMLPDERDRRRLCPAHFAAFVRYGLLAGHVFTTEGSLEGVAVWFPPGRVEMQPDLMDQAGISELSSLLGAEAFGRILGFLEYLEPLHKRDVQPPHWYLLLIGVEPQRQSAGIGSTLLRTVLAQADAEQVPCYLETTQPTNVPFYRKHGFEIVVEDVEPTSGLRFWTFRRDPRT